MNSLLRILYIIGTLGCAIYSGTNFYQVSKSDLSNRCWYVHKGGELRRPVCSSSMARGTAGAVAALFFLGGSTWGLAKENSDNI